MASTHGTVHWSELMTNDAKAACDFYAKLCGWTFENFPTTEGAPPYNVAMSGGQPVGGIMEVAGTDFAGKPPMWMTYIHVDDVDGACKTTEASGGKVVTPCFDVPMVGRIAMIQDASGGVVGLITPAAQG